MHVEGYAWSLCPYVSSVSRPLQSPGSQPHPVTPSCWPEELCGSLDDHEDAGGESTWTQRGVLGARLPGWAEASEQNGLDGYWSPAVALSTFGQGMPLSLTTAQHWAWLFSCCLD